MEKDTEVKNEYITSADLAEQTKIILGAMDARLNSVDTKIDGLKADIKDVRDELYKELYIVRDELKTDIKDVRDELYRVRDELKADINDTQTSIDGYVKAQEDSKQEFVITKEEMKQVKQVIGQKLGVEVRVF